ncbi:response regulator [Marinobacter sp. HL-58]|uniref:response regulator n=1 Tax=Marinobacter sp. HL-58 TaxID=1479237 RepID=UPI000481C021|nr:response regulator [Marinobacter sp. HL-58]KPQ02381.1 MAG: Chemotaxis protein CheC, inhibitor of MCP methylation [Marinobacter sp. HL-58]
MAARVLICDDSSLARKQMARALPENWNARVTFAIDGRDALEQLRAGAAELMFLDLNMPEMDGYQVLEAIRKEDLPVLTIVVSGDIQPEARARVRKLGAIDFIKKPTDTNLVIKLLQDYGFLRAEDLAAETGKPEETSPTDETPICLNDYLQEVANVAMGRSSDLLARLLKVFVRQPIPRVEMIARSELSMAISAAEDDSNYSAVCQGFTGSGIAGEALLLFADASVSDMAELLQYDDMDTESLEVEVLMDMSSILFGAFLKGIGDQLDLKLGLGHPTVLGRHRHIGDLLEHHSRHQEKLLCIEISYELEDRDISCDMLVLLTEDSVPFLEQRLQYLVD